MAPCLRKRKTMVKWKDSTRLCLKKCQDSLPWRFPWEEHMGCLGKKSLPSLSLIKRLRILKRCQKRRYPIQQRRISWRLLIKRGNLSKGAQSEVYEPEIAKPLYIIKIILLYNYKYTTILSC